MIITYYNIINCNSKRIDVKKSCVWFSKNIKEKKKVKENNFIMFVCTIIFFKENYM